MFKTAARNKYRRFIHFVNRILRKETRYFPRKIKSRFMCQDATHASTHTRTHTTCSLQTTYDPTTPGETSQLWYCHVSVLFMWPTVAGFGARGNAQLVEALRYKPVGGGFDSRCHWNFSFFQPHYSPAVNSALNTNEYQEHFMRGKSGRRVKLTLPPSRANCLEIWESQPLGTLWACTGIALALTLL